MEECHKMITDQVDWANPEGDQVRIDVSKPLPLSGPPGCEFKHDYTIIESPREVVFPVDNNERKIMRFNEIYKFSDGTLTNIMKALDYRVKEYKVNRLNPDVSVKYEHVVMNLTCLRPPAATVGNTYSINTARDQVEFLRISLTGFRSCNSRSQYQSISKQTIQYE
nr:hypothetical protein [Tanacetum cinerariifolium]